LKGEGVRRFLPFEEGGKIKLAFMPSRGRRYPGELFFD